KRALLEFATELADLSQPLRDKYDDELLQELFSQYMANKHRIPVYGAIIVNSKLDRYLIVKAFDGWDTWTFPKGKVEPGETGIQCAIREINEETGLNIENFITEYSPLLTVEEREHQLTMYIVIGVNDKQKLQTTVREATGRLEW
ncbi:MAG: putative decapping enzyme, partial [Streblomastix strix]